jgi:hypothetical protein
MAQNDSAMAQLNQSQTTKTAATVSTFEMGLHKELYRSVVETSGFPEMYSMPN